MSKVYADKIEPRASNADITLGASGQTVTITGNDIRVNTLKDSGGNTLFTSDGAGNITSSNSAFQSNMRLLQTQIGQNVTQIDFTGIDSAYDVYCFKLINVQQEGRRDPELEINGSTNNGEYFGISKTTTFFEAYHREDDGSTANVAYDSSHDLSNSTSGQPISTNLEHRPSSTVSGELWLFGPSSNFTTQFYGTFQTCSGHTTVALNTYPAGYFNTTTPINAISFKTSAANIKGIIKMYGLL